MRVELNDCRIHIRQGDRVSRSGFVRVGDTVEMVSAQEVYEVLQRAARPFTASLSPIRVRCGPMH